MRPSAKPRTEGATHKRRYDADILSRNAEHGRDLVGDVVHPLCLVPQGQAVPVPCGDGGMHLDRVVVLARNDVGLVNLHFGGREKSFSIAAPDLCRATFALIGLPLRRQLRLPGGDVDFSGFGCVADADQAGRMVGLFEGLGDRERNRLALMTDLIILEHMQTFTNIRIDKRFVSTIGEPRRVSMRQDRHYARSAFRHRSIDGSDTAARNRAPHDDAVGLPRPIEFRSIAGATGHFQAAVDAAYGLSNEGRRHARAPTISTARTIARCMSSILKSLCPRPCAPSAARAAARRSTAGSRLAPASAASTCGARQGLAPTPPSATRACRMREPRSI